MRQKTNPKKCGVAKKSSIPDPPLSIEGVILAAGLSSRADSFKMELPLLGKSLIEHSILNMTPFCKQIFIVGGYKIEKIIQFTQNYPHVHVKFNADFEKGMFSSVKVGISHVTAPWFFFMPGDFPLIGPSVFLKLLEAIREFPSMKIAVPVYNERKGHPILMSGECIPGILSEPEGSNLKIFINRCGFQAVRVDDPGILMDIDTQDDFLRVKEYASKYI